MPLLVDPTTGRSLEATTTGGISRGANVEFGDAARDVRYVSGQYPFNEYTQQLSTIPQETREGLTMAQTPMLQGNEPRDWRVNPTAGVSTQPTSPMNVSQQSPYQTSQAGYQAPTTGSVQSYYGTQPTTTGTAPSAGAPTTQQIVGQTGYVNPSQVTGTAQEFGTDAGQFMIQPFMQPFQFEQQRGENLGLVSGFEQALQAQETLPAMRSRLEGRFFIPELREAFQTGRESLADVTAQMRAMPENIAETTRESLMTAGQRANLLGAKLEPLQKIATQMGENVSRIGAMLTENEKNMNDAMMMEVAQQKKMLMPWEWKYDLDKVMQAREFTGWTFSNQLELNRLISNQQAGLTWTNAEATRAHQLAMQEASYDLQLRNSERMADYGLDNFDFSIFG